LEPELPLTATVIIVTLNRPDCLRRCLDALSNQTLPVHQTIVVDGSPDGRSKLIVEDFPGVIYLHNERGYGHMTLSRNIGLAHATGDVVAMIDDDAFAEPEWMANLLAAYADEPNVGGVGGRAINNTPEADVPLDQIGRIWPNGCLSANFHMDAPQRLEVEHVIGCNMSFRRDVLARLGGLRDDFPGTEVGEDTDISIRVRKLGYRMVFEPRAVVFHLGAPHSKGRRFDLRYEFFHRRNNFQLLIRNYGPGMVALKYLVRTSYLALRDATRKCAGAVLRVLANFAGAAVGMVAGTWMYLRHGRDPVRHDPAGQAIARKIGVSNNATGTVDNTAQSTTAVTEKPVSA
jgi:GT2 family glycosyltransferase